MSVSVVYLPSAYTRPIAIPATGDLIGTPASMSDNVDPHTDAMDVEPFDESTSETRRIGYGPPPWLGTTGPTAPSASAPWPISRRFGDPTRPTSPVEKGGK